MKIQVQVEVNAPEGATHYDADLLCEPNWFKCIQIGVVGDHWFMWKDEKWFFYSHYAPRWARPILEVNYASDPNQNH